MRRIAVLSALLTLLLGTAAAAAQSGYPDHRELEVNDFAGVLSAQETERLRGLLRDLRQRTGIEATVVTVDSIGDYGTGDRSIESFATGLFNAWGVGDATRNDGVMILVAVGDRKVRIEVGSGYGSSEDRAMKAVIDSAMLPHFRNGDYGRGIVQGTETVVAHFGRTPAAPGVSVPTEAPSTGAPSSTSQPGVADPAPRRGGALGWLLGLLAAGLGGGGLWLARRPPRCGRCGNPMVAMDEQRDDAHLDQGQRLEENLGSIDHVVYQCPGCGQMEPRKRRKWFSGFGACPECGYRTSKSTSRVVRQPTYSSTGSKKVETSCRHCGRHHVDYVVVPMLTRSSSSSSSGSSFGGGSSSGGGASGSW